MRTAWLLLSILLVMPAAAYEEAEATLVDARIERVWHEPQVPAPGQQWHGFIQFQQGHNITDVRYQICRVGQVCFAQPTLAMRLDDNKWTFDTSDYKAGHNPVDWGRNYPVDQPGDWRVGVKFYLFFEGADHTDYTAAELTPKGIPEGDARCEPGGNLTWLECEETRYFAWDLPAISAGSQEAPAPPLWAWAVAVGGVLWVRRR